MATTLAAAVGVMLILEGILPFASPAKWREMFRRAIKLPDRQLQTLGLGSMIVGAILVMLAL